MTITQQVFRDFRVIRRWKYMINVLTYNVKLACDVQNPAYDLDPVVL